MSICRVCNQREGTERVLGEYYLCSECYHKLIREIDRVWLEAQLKQGKTIEQLREESGSIVDNTKEI